MMKRDQSISGPPKLLIRQCHKCGHANESSKELERCQKCSKSFLPLIYATAQDAKTSKDYKNLFQPSSDVSEDDLIKGLAVIWD